MKDIAESTLNLIAGFRNPAHMRALSKLIYKESKTPIKIMEVCGGHTHTIMKYGIIQLLPKHIEFIHGPGCPVCIMPKERIDAALALASCKDVIFSTLGDMIRVPGSKSSLQELRARGADVRALYSPLDVLKIANENPTKKVIFFAIGFETTTPMSAAIIDKTLKEGIKNISFFSNHVLVPEPMEAIMLDENSKIDAFLGPSHVSVITGTKIYERVCEKFKMPIVVAGFEPIDVMEAILKIVKQVEEGRYEVENQYIRAVSRDGNLHAQKLVDKYFERRAHFNWRGIGDIPNSALKLKDEYAFLDAQIIFKDLIPKEHKKDHKLCICGDILKGLAKPYDCKVFGKACVPSSPIGSCMVSSEGACAAYYKYGSLLKGRRV